MIIVDSSPLIVLLKSNLEYILPKLFDEIILPQSVSDEILAGQSNDIAKQKLPTISWLKIFPDANPNHLTINVNLGKGEIAVLNLALEMSFARVVLDDFAARKSAKDLKIPFIGTGGLLVLAKQNNLIPSVADALKEVQNNGLWLSDSVIEMIKQKADE